MARGFLAGVVHGGLLSAVALAGLSLLAPLPEDAPQPGPEDPAPLAAPEEDTPTAVPARPAAAEPAPAEAVPVEPAPAADGPDAKGPDAPRAEALDLPSGSEFGRGGDLPPVLPAQGPAPRAEPTEPLAVPAQDAPNVQPFATVDPARPETQSDGLGPTLPQAGEAAPTLTLPAPSPQDVPRDGPAGLPVPIADAGQDALPQIAPGPAASSDRSPRLPSPDLDLSLPPDLTDLRQLERN